jgi:molybdopterin converting factor small subunit
MFTVLYFGPLKSLTGKSSETIGSDITITQLLSHLATAYEDVQLIKSCAVSVNLEYVDSEEYDQTTLKNGDEVALIPPVSSG